MSRVLMAVWAYMVSWVGSAIVHVVDSDVGGVRGLGDPSVLLSVSIIAFIIFVPVLICCAAYLRGRWNGFLKVVAAFAFGFGVDFRSFGHVHVDRSPTRSLHIARRLDGVNQERSGNH